MLEVKRDYTTSRNAAFTVTDKESGKVHSVLFKFDKCEWSCDCMWNSLKETACKHIKEVVKLVNKKNLNCKEESSN